LAVVDRNRTDDAAAMVRLEGARSALADVSIPPTATAGRAFGSVTADNDAARRSKGEIAVQPRGLPADATANVAGHLPAAALDLPTRIGPGHHVRLRLP